MKIKLNSDDNLPLKKILRLYNSIILVMSAFYVGNKYYPIFLDKCLYKLAATRSNKFAE